MGKVYGACLLAALCATGIALTVNEASAQCSAQSIVRHHLSSGEAISPAPEPRLLQSAAAVPVWKTIQLGTVADKFDLLKALDRAGCNIGGLAHDIFANPDFVVTGRPPDLDLFVVSVAELGLSSEETSLANVYRQAQTLGFELAPAEAGPQLRLQYFDQPVGEFLNIAMEPIRKNDGNAVIFVVANGGAGLLLLGQDANADMQLFPSSRFVFVRQTDIEASRK